MSEQAWMLAGLAVALLALSAWYLGHSNRRVANLARVGTVLGGAGVFLTVVPAVSASLVAAVTSVGVLVVAVGALFLIGSILGGGL